MRCSHTGAMLGRASRLFFAILFLKEKLAWNYLLAFTFLGGAAFFAFAIKALVPDTS